MVYPCKVFQLHNISTSRAYQRVINRVYEFVHTWRLCSFEMCRPRMSQWQLSASILRDGWGALGVCLSDSWQHHRSQFIERYRFLRR
jgi:hypothetical protein